MSPSLALPAIVMRRFLDTEEVFELTSNAWSTMLTLAPREIVGLVRYALKFAFVLTICFRFFARERLGTWRAGREGRQGGEGFAVTQKVTLVFKQRACRLYDAAHKLVVPGVGSRFAEANFNTEHT